MASQLNIKNPATIRLARDLAAASGESVTQAIHRSLEERMSRRRDEPVALSEEEVARRVTEFQALIAGARTMWKPEFDGVELSTRHGELLYDERGLPT